MKYIFFIITPLVILSILINPPDSDWWIHNSKLFLNALLRADIKSSYLSFDAQMHPGLSIEWVSALIQYFLPTILKELILDIRGLATSFLVPLHNLVFSTILVICLILGLRIFAKYFKKTTIIISSLYILLLPTLILVPGSTYLDWILSGTLFLSTALWIQYLNDKKPILIFWIGILTGVAVLTKYIALFIIPSIFIMALVKGTPVKNFIKPLVTILIVALLILLIFYPAMWVDPGYVLSGLFGERESLYYFTLSLSTIKEIWKQLWTLSIHLNPMIMIGSAITLICLFTKRINKELLLPGVVGLSYLIFMIISFQFVFYSGSPLLNFVNQLTRYVLPAIMLLAITFFEVIYTSQRFKKIFMLRNILIILIFLYEITRIVTYLISAYSLF